MNKFFVFYLNGIFFVYIMLTTQYNTHMLHEYKPTLGQDNNKMNLILVYLVKHREKSPIN